MPPEANFNWSRLFDLQMAVSYTNLGLAFMLDLPSFWNGAEGKNPREAVG